MRRLLLFLAPLLLRLGVCAFLLVCALIDALGL